MATCSLHDARDRLEDLIERGATIAIGGHSGRRVRLVSPAAGARARLSDEPVA